ncbi:MAG: sigma-70 family RNA polymerase sigma factor [Clostridia bacterium]|nr:sigma-70 family RNA polymerase sigma factor [Clostridia bacterium]
MPRKCVNCDSFVFDALVFDKYRGSGTNAAELRRKLDIVYRAMAKELTPIELKALTDYYVRGVKMKDIAKERGVHPSTVTRQIRRAKDKIKHITNYY